MRLRHPVILTFLLLPAAAAHAQLDKGHQILLDRGIQIQAQAFYMPEDTGGNPFIAQRYFDANFTSINWHYHPANPSFTAAYPNYPWSRWINTSGTYDVGAAEQPYKNQLVAVQYKDENSLDDPGVRADFKNWFDNARPNFPNTILYTNQLAFNATPENLSTYMQESKPDMMFMDSYRWKVGNTEGTWHLLSDMQRYRKAALRGNDQTSARPIPYGLLTQTFHGEGLWRDPSESELRANHFMAWALGYSYTSAFTYNYGTSSLFSPGFDTNSPTPTYHQLKEVNKEGNHLGPALVRLLSRDVLFVPGQHMSGGTPVNNPTPIDMLAYPGGFSGATKDPYIRGVQSIANLGTTNDGLKGDFVLSWFQVLDESLDGDAHSGEWYFMITNGLTDPNGSALDTRQTIQLNFAASVPDTVQRLNRDTGLIDELFMPIIPNTGGRRALVLELEGGTADLFKFKTGAPFVGVQPIPEPSAATAAIVACLLFVRRGRQDPCAGDALHSE